MKRKEQAEKRRWEILSAALDVFIRKGFAAAKIQDIAQSVGMSIGLLFHYFESKEKLYEELIRIGISGPQTVLSAIKAESLEFFRTAARDIIRYVETEPFVAKMFVLMGQARCNDAAPESVKELLSKSDIITISVKKIRQGQKDGSIKEGDPLAVAIAFWGAMQGIAELAALMPGILIPDSEWIVDIIRRHK